MRLDQARIAIRERNWGDILDLALQLIRRHFKAVCAVALVGAVPMALVNVGIVYAIFGDQPLEDSFDDIFFVSMLLVMIQAPLATAPLTLYLGQALFRDRPDPKQIARDFVGSLPQLFWLQIVLRTVLIVPVVTWFIPYGVWPYLNEIILLDRNPLVARKGQMTTMKRNGMFHRGNSGDYVARALFSGLLAMLLMSAFWVTQEMLLGFFLGIEQGQIAQFAAMQGVLWIVVVYFTAARFLGYLDQRIRHEGWEVELFLRAQRDRLTRIAA